MNVTKKTRRQYQLKHFGAFWCERLGIYSDSKVRGVEKVISFWSGVSPLTGEVMWFAQVGTGKLHHIDARQVHNRYKRNEFTFGFGRTAQRWLKL